MNRGGGGGVGGMGAYLKFDVGNCGDVVNASMKKKTKKGAFTKSIDQDETPQNVVSHQGLRYLPR